MRRIGSAASLAVALLGGAAVVRSASRTAEVNPMGDASMRLAVEGDLRLFEGATGWINSPPLAPAGLRGKVVVVDFWTFTCVNWLRTLPYVRAWAAK